MTERESDVIQVLEDVRERVRARRAAMGPQTDMGDQALAELQAAIQDVNATARVNSHLPLLWEDMVIGRLRAFVQRVVRRLLRWYINPIVDQQNTYNAAVARALTLLAAENQRLHRQLADLNARFEQEKKA